MAKVPSQYSRSVTTAEEVTHRQKQVMWEDSFWAPGSPDRADGAGDAGDPEPTTILPPARHQARGHLTTQIMGPGKNFTLRKNPANSYL